MDKKNMKNIVILKNIPSNLIEEAIVVVKDKKKIMNDELSKKGKNKSIQGYMNIEDLKKIKQINQDNRGFIVKEAEMIINNYLENVEYTEKTKNRQKIENKYHRLKYINGVLFIISALSTFICIFK